MAERKVKIGMGQILVESGQIRENMARALQMVKEAADSACRIVVLPECLDLGWANPEAETFAEPIPGKHSDRLCKSASDHNIYIAAGLTEKHEDKVYNTAIFISPDGEILAKHRKINLLSVEYMYLAGQTLSVTDTPFGTIGINICADNLTNSMVLGQAQGKMGAQLLLSPSSWAVDAGHDNRLEPYGRVWEEPYKALASRYGMSVVGVSNVGWILAGSWTGRKCIGCSLAVGPSGVIRKAPYGTDKQQLEIVEVPL